MWSLAAGGAGRITPREAQRVDASSASSVQVLESPAHFLTGQRALAVAKLCACRTASTPRIALTMTARVQHAADLIRGPVP
jgi:hypothetical protein